ncbi:hypothetical protein JQX13_26105 [Archangium violaceum]|uniref:DUF6683 family protein n=1 Tax=Archangium violaceum TaxID=83451 RepID=UPI00193B5BBB|nr:DUF6683 family protein [Archangium violaceum]QRK13197.1 hypothetical protein JQX13_26105 [Archangium violaceum]
MNHDFRALLAMWVACILLGSSGPAEAKPFSPYRQYSSSLFINGNFKLTFQRQWGEPRAASGTSVESPTISPVLLPLSVSSFRTVGEPVVPRRIATGVPGLEREQRQRLEAALLELLKDYEHLLDENDEQRLKNNLAGAFNFLFLSSYCALKNGEELSGEQRESMLEQINASIAMRLKERRLSDREKQELYESVVLSGSIIRGLYNEGRDKGRAEQLKSARELARAMLEQLMGLTIEKVRLDGNAVRIG